VFSWFYIDDRTFISNADGTHQHFVALAYWGRYWRQIFSHFISTGRLVIPMFDFSIGYGSDILTVMHYYVAGDPLAWLAVFFPVNHTEPLYAFLILLRLYLIGIAFSAYCHKLGKPSFDTLCGAMVYIFSAFVMHAIRHPFFLNPLIYLPLLLLGIEKIFRNEKPYLFIIMVFLSAASNVYFFYKLSILIVIYATIRFFAIYGKDIRRYLLPLGRFTLYYLIGVFMAGIVILPVGWAILSSSRQDVSHIVDLFYPFAYYQRLIAGFIWTDNPGQWTFIGHSPIALIAVVLLFTKRRVNTQLKVAFVVLTIFLLFPVVGHVFNGFTNVTNRWVFGYSFLLALITVVMMPDIIRPSSRQLVIITLFSTVYFFVLFAIRQSRNDEILVMAGILLILVIIMHRVKDFVENPDKRYKFKIDLAYVAILGFIVVSLGTMGFNRNAPIRRNYVNEFRRPNTVYNWHTVDSGSHAVKQLRDYTFYRYARNRFGQGNRLNTSMLNQEYGVNFYFSLGDPYVPRFLIDDMNLTVNVPFRYYDLDGRAMLHSLAGVRYFAVGRGFVRYLPYGFDKLVYKGQRYHVFENKYALPFGYTYEYIMCEEDYRNLSVIERQQALLQGAVLTSSHNFSRLDTPVFTHSIIPYEVHTPSGIQYDGESFVVRNTNHRATLRFDGLPNVETYINFNNLNFSAFDPKENHTPETLAELGFMYRFRLNVSHREWSLGRGVSSSTITMRTPENIQKNFVLRTPRNNYYFGQHDFVVNLGYSVDGITEITIEFQRQGVYTFDDLLLYAQPMQDFGNHVSRLHEVVMENVDTSSGTSLMGTNRITGTVHSDTERLLVFSLPFSSGWRAYLGNERVELLNVNTMFSGIFVPPGHHYVTLRYTTPFIGIGLALSVTGLCLFAGIIGFHTWKLSQAKKKEGGFAKGCTDT